MVTTPGSLAFQTRNLAAVLLRDWARYRKALAREDAAYLSLCNRNEVLESAPDGCGYRCNWQWTSDLHAPKFVPRLGTRLMVRALRDHPIRRMAAPGGASQPADVTFLIGHRGMARLPHLLATLESIAAQQGPKVDCLVVEQDTDPLVAPHLPPWVRYLHTPPPSKDMPYCRSWAFNIGARHCGTHVLVLHDNDMLVPTDYAANLLDRVRQGYDVVNLKRFIFYLTEHHTHAVFSGKAGLAAEAPESIVQNLEAGGSVAITAEAFERIGGMDESFIGWGGEDNEFWERAQTGRVWNYGALPIVHLWHSAQPGKNQADNRTLAHYRSLTEVPVDSRIAHLRSVPQGCEGGPNITGKRSAQPPTRNGLIQCAD